MKKLCIFVGMTILGWIGWWLGNKIGIMTAWVFSGIGSMAGVYVGWHINRDYWDLVDVSTEHIVGSYLWHRGKSPLRVLAKLKLLWDRRISIMATFHYIKRGEFSETLHIAKLLLRDPEDLIHKAVGWMLREIGKRDSLAEEKFLKVCYRTMPRTMLRYAIEKFPDRLRQRYLRGEI